VVEVPSRWRLRRRAGTRRPSSRHNRWTALRFIPDGLVLAGCVTGYLSFTTPLARYLQAPSTPPRANIRPPESVSDP
jgi:hypothetical protein